MPTEEKLFISKEAAEMFDEDSLLHDEELRNQADHPVTTSLSKENIKVNVKIIDFKGKVLLKEKCFLNKIKYKNRKLVLTLEMENNAFMDSLPIFLESVDFLEHSGKDIVIELEDETNLFPDKELSIVEYSTKNSSREFSKFKLMLFVNQVNN